MKRALAIVLCVVLMLACLPANAYAVTELKNLYITLDLPDPGKTPTATATCGTGYTIHSIDWKDCDTNQFLEPGDKIQAGHDYYAYLWVEAQNGYQFASVNDLTPNVNVFVNGVSCAAGKAFEYIAPAMVYVEYYISDVPETAWIKTVDLTVTEPSVGKNPTYGVIGSTFASGNVTFGGSAPAGKKDGFAWEESGTKGYMDPDATFQAGKTYTLYITLLPRVGYKFVPQPVTRVNGKLVGAQTEYDHFLAIQVDFPALTHTHTPSDWRTTQIYHYTVCTTCGDFLDQEDHKGGTATCEEKGICTICGYTFLEESETHTPDTSKWIARQEQYHYHKCKLCGAHCDIEDHRWSPTYLYQDKNGHAWICADCQAHSEIEDHRWSPTYLYQGKDGHAWICADCKAYSEIEKHTPGPTATDTTPQTCKDCGYIIEPAKNHKHDLTKVPQTPATCTEEGNIEYYFCTGCNDCFTDAGAKNKIPETMSVMVGALGHTASESWSMDGAFHWRICSTCKQALDETKMQHDITAGMCTTCNYVPGSGEAAADVPETTPPAAAETGTVAPKEEHDHPTETPSAPEKNQEKKLSWGTVVLVAMVCFAAAITATVIILKMDKKRR